MKAADQYAKAAQLGHAEGMYALGQLHFHGYIGNRPDYKSALKWFRKSAVQPPLSNLHLRNIGVAEAQHTLGLCYDEGIGVEKSLGMALSWYQKGSSNGSADAANNLGVHHLRQGELDKAHQYWELSASRGCVKAMLSLSELCLQRHDSHMAVEWNTRAAANGSAEAEARAKQFGTAAQQKSERLEDNELCEWERRQGLSAHAYSLEQRLHRRLASTLSPASADAMLSCSRPAKLLNKGRLYLPVSRKDLTSTMPRCWADIKQLAVTPRDGCWQLFGASSVPLLQWKQKTILVWYSIWGLLLEHIVASMPQIVKERVKRGVDLVLAQCQQKEPSQLDEYARICYSCLHMEQVEHTIGFLQLCISRYPNRAFFYQLQGAMHGFLKQFDIGVRHLNHALVLLSDDPQLLYEHAAMLCLSDHSNPETVIACYVKYLHRCPADDRTVPEAYYAIAAQPFLIAEKVGQNRLSSPEVIKWYNKGQEAEARQLPCFLPYISWKPPGRFTHPKRVELIKANRAFQQALLDASEGVKHPLFTTSPALRQEAPTSLVGLQSLLLSDMDPTREKVWAGHVLSLTVIDAAYSTSPSIHLVVEDDHGHVERLFLYNYPPHEAEHLIRKRFVVGCKMAVINPYLRLAQDGKPGIRVDDYKSIICHPVSEAGKAVCWFCLTSGATKMCAKCHLGCYWSKRCQQQDWNLYDHKRICIQIAESKEVEYLQMLRATGQRLVFCADAAWSHRGHEANQCCWLLLNANNRQIVFVPCMYDKSTATVL